jgi:hypothetical protein
MGAGAIGTPVASYSCDPGEWFLWTASKYLEETPMKVKSKIKAGGLNDNMSVVRSAK